MADLIQPVAQAVDMPEARSLPRHSLAVRITHWINTLAVFALLVSGKNILLAHPRLYWGETGAYGSPALIELPLTLDVLQSGKGRSLHFLAAWVFVLNGIAYVGPGLFVRHFSRDFGRTYSAAQRIAYLIVVFLLVPVTVLTGLAMSPAVSAAFPWIAPMFGGHQSSRTVHFFGAALLTAFLFIHVGMVVARGFRGRMRGMITGFEGL
jgi:thiosulfate reductase cytochrome b subunit